jgi:hypothetical protein
LNFGYKATALIIPTWPGHAFYVYANTERIITALYYTVLGVL